MNNNNNQPQQGPALGSVWKTPRGNVEIVGYYNNDPAHMKVRPANNASAEEMKLFTGELQQLVSAPVQAGGRRVRRVKKTRKAKKTRGSRRS
jgi:hypothetical protein